MENLVQSRGEEVSCAQVKTGLFCLHYTLRLSFGTKDCHKIHGHSTPRFIFHVFVLKENKFFLSLMDAIPLCDIIEVYIYRVSQEERTKLR